MIPIGDYNPTKRIPYLTYTIIAINVLVFLWEITLSDRQLFILFRDYSVVPLLVSRDPLSLTTLLDCLRSLFFHGGWLHLGSNMLFLWVFGDNIEDRLGGVLFVMYYIASGLAAIFAQVIINPDSTTPLVGASGAIAGILGGYLVLYPSARIKNIVFLGFFFFFVDLPALLVLGFWFAMQLFNGAATLGVPTNMGGGVAFFAHIGGFLTGVAIMGYHRIIFGAPPDVSQQMIQERRIRRANPGTIFQPRQYTPRPSGIPTTLPPDPTLSPEERRTRQRAAFEILRDQFNTPIWMLTPSRTFYGRVQQLTDTTAVLRESDGKIYVIPLENIVKIS